MGTLTLQDLMKKWYLSLTTSSDGDDVIPVIVKNQAKIAAIWAGSGITNAPNPELYEVGQIGANTEGESTGLTYHNVRDDDGNLMPTDVTVWTHQPTSGTVTGGQSDPDGGTDAYKIESSGAAFAALQIENQLAVAKDRSIKNELWFKWETGAFINLNVYGGKKNESEAIADLAPDWQSGEWIKLTPEIDHVLAADTHINLGMNGTTDSATAPFIYYIYAPKTVPVGMWQATGGTIANLYGV